MREETTSCKRKKQTHNRKQTGESDKSRRTPEAADGRAGNGDAAAEKGKLQHAYEKKIMQMELQMGEEEEEEELVWQAEMPRKRTEQVERMKAKQQSFEERLASMDKELAGLSSFKVPKHLREGPSSKFNRNALKLMKENFQKLVEDDESAEEEADDDKYSKNWALQSQSSDSHLERKVNHNASRVIRKKVVSMSQDGLGQ